MKTKITENYIIKFKTESHRTTQLNNLNMATGWATYQQFKNQTIQTDESIPYHRTHIQTLPDVKQVNKAMK